MASSQRAWQLADNEVERQLVAMAMLSVLNEQEHISGEQKNEFIAAVRQLRRPLTQGNISY